MLTAGVSTSCLYPKLLEESVYDLAVNGIGCIEVFVNTDSELKRSYISGLADTMKRFEISCRSFHPFTCPIEPMLFFSGYERRTADALEYYKKYFNAMNILGAEIFVFHGNKKAIELSAENYCQSFGRLVELGKSFGITVAQENVSRCQSGRLSFMVQMADILGEDAHFVFDTKQAVRADEDSFNIVRTLKKHIVHVHISDHGDEGDCLLIGRGRFNIRQLVRVLYEEDIDCALVIELYRNNFDGISDLTENYTLLNEMLGSVRQGRQAVKLK